MSLILGILLMLQADRTPVEGLKMNELDFEFLTKGDIIVDAQDIAGRMQQNLTQDEINEMAQLAPYAQKFMLLLHKAETGEMPSVEQANQMISQMGQEKGSINEQGVPSEQASEGGVPQNMQREAMVPPRPVEGQMPQNAPEMMAEGGVAAGPVGVVDKPGADNSGVADDVPAESDGFVINAAAVRKVGLRKINDMIQKAIKYAQEQGIELDFGKTPVNAEKILVSNGEVVIPDVLARIIGYDELEAVNALGAEETDEIIETQEEQSEKPIQEMPVALARGDRVKEIIGRYAGPFPAEDAAIQEEVIESTTPYSSENADYVDMDRVKQVYSLYWNPETKVKKRGQRQRDYTSGSVWMTHLDKGEKYKLQPGIAEAIREVMPAFDYELKEIGFYNPEALEYFAKIESKGGKDLINEKTKDYGVFQINMANAKKYFTKDTEFKKFLKFYGKKAAALTGVSAHTLREIYLDNPDDFKELMLQSPKTNLAVGLAMTLLPNMWKTERKKNLDN